MAHPFRQYPLFLDLRGRRVLVVGGGSVASRKVQSLLEAGARVTVTAPEISDGIAAMAIPSAGLDLMRREWRAEDLEGATLAIAASNDREVNLRVASECRSRGILVNVVDDPSACDFFVPAVVERGVLRLAISTGGASPAVARLLRETLEELIDSSWELLADLLGLLREPARQQLDAPRRRELFASIASTGFLALLKNDREAARQALLDLGERFGISIPDEALSRIDDRG
ncbi:MAG TPA: bifunctional precorrin-2 dehydrogenase/sirohydrochlorin ferrochelatase [Thermoanaerobaculia bacterium]|nr:bifunctional precorrin-2 dehydrogenase/sirohydrochlorin ferrochelatase [Thermoanaerobaculia bacterium]